MSHAAVDSEVLLWFVVVLMLLLVMFTYAIVRTPPRAIGPPQPPELTAPALRPPPLAGRPHAAGFTAGVGTARAGYRPRHAGAPKPELVVAGRLQVSGGPPWEPAPKPPALSGRGTVPWLAVAGQVPTKASACRELPPSPGLAPLTGSMSCATEMTGPGPGRLPSAQMDAASTVSGGRPGAHRQARRRGAHRVDISTVRQRKSTGRTGRHRAGVH